MHVNLGTILRLFGFDLGSPLALLHEFTVLAGQPALSHELSTHLTDARRAQVAQQFRGIADDLDAKSFDKAATDILALLAGIKA